MSNHILVTGFGPFENHAVNASWEAVKFLPSMFSDNKLIIHEVPVDYKYVCEEIPKLWETYKPQLVIHVGVSSFTDQFTLELKAHNHGYCKEDVNGFCINNNSSNMQEKETKINLTNIITKLNEQNIKADISTNCGRYLCEFIYYQSLNINDSRSLFIHVPPLNKPFSAKELALGLKSIIQIIIEQLNIS